MKLVLAVIILFASVTISPQSIQLRGKVIDINKQPVKNLPIRFTSFGDAITTGSGEFVITIPQDVNFVDVAIKDDNIQILYPVDSKIPVPPIQILSLLLLFREVRIQVKQEWMNQF